MNTGWMIIFLVLFPIVCGLISYIVGRFNKIFRDLFADFVVLAELLVAVLLCVFSYNGSLAAIDIPYFAGMGLSFTTDGFRLLYCTVIAFMWFVTTVFSKEYFKHYRNRNRYYMFMLLTLGATMGVFLSKNLYTTFIFFEMMSFTSYVWVAHDEKSLSLRAAQTYLAIAVIGGMVMLMGLFMMYNSFGTLEINEIMDKAKAFEDKRVVYAIAICVSIGFGAKAGAFPLHVWLPKAHPVAPAPASALLSGVLTKSGVFGLLVVSSNMLYADHQWGLVILYIGTITMFGGALLALFSVNLKRTLACSSMSQIGFVMVGIGMQGLLGEENALAARGTVLHMMNHSLIKLVLFVCAGVIFMNIHKLDLDEIRGYGRKKPLLKFIFLMGALGIGGIPLWNGYVSKTLLHESIVEYGPSLAPIEWIFLISGGITVAYMTKLFVAIFVERNENEETQKKYDENVSYMGTATKVLLTISALILFVIGALPNIIMDRLADVGVSMMNAGEMEHSVHYFNLENLKGGLISILIGALLYIVVVRLLLMKKNENGRSYPERWPAWLDLEEGLYRPFLAIMCSVGGFFSRVLDSMVDFVVVLLRKTIYRDRKLPFELPEGNWNTFYAGKVLNYLQERKIRKNPDLVIERHDYIHELAVKYSAFKEAGRVIKRSMSFGLLMFCGGFLAITFYMLCMFYGIL